MIEWNRRGILAVSGAALAATTVRAEEAQAPALETAFSRVQDMMGQAKVPAAGIAVVHHGAVVAARGLGLASLPFQVRADENTLFHLGSVSKQFTAALVFGLAESGAINLDDPVGRHAKGLPEAFAAVPIRNLLSHTGGIPDYYGLPGFDADRPIEREAFLTAVGALPMDFQPGDAWGYSNTGYVLLGYMLADVTGRSYRELTTERLFGRIGLPSARIDEARSIIAGRAEPYVFEDGAIHHAIGMDSDLSGWPDGGVLMTARDAAQWELALQNGPVPSSSTVADLTRPFLMSTGRSAAYGGGWFTDQVAGHAVQSHSGQVPGFLTFAWRAPATRTAVTVMINMDSGPGGRFMSEAALILSEAVAPGSTPLSLEPIQDDAPDVTAQTLALFARGRMPLVADRFAPEIAALIGTKATEFMPPNFGTDTTGIGWTLVERHDEPGGHVRRYRLVRNGAMRHVSVAYAPDGRIYRVRSI